MHKPGRNTVGDEIHPPLRHPFVVDGGRDPRWIAPIVPDPNILSHHPFAELHEGAALGDRQRREAGEGEVLQDRAHRVLLEDHGVLAGLEIRRAGRTRRLVSCLASDRRRIDLADLG